MSQPGASPTSAPGEQAARRSVAPRGDGRLLALAGLAFFCSGAAALVYQVAWQRLLALCTGVGTYSIALIVTAFMAGLGIGSHLGGRSSARLEPRRALLAFALIELGVGGFGAVSGSFYYDLLYVRGAWLYDRPWRAGLFHFVALAAPTILMGMSLPLLVRATVRDTASAARRIALLYGVNVVGAAAGALATPWLLVRWFGIDGALSWAAAANVAAALAALLGLGRLARPGAEAHDTDGPAAPLALDEPGRPFALWLALYALSGFVALGLEIVWFRIIDVGVKSTAFTFGTVLAVYLAGLASGSLLGAWGASRIARPLRAFLLLQCAILALAGAAVAAAARLPPELPLYARLVQHFRTQEPPLPGTPGGGALLAGLYLGLPAYLFLLPTTLMGVAFTALQRAVQDEPRTSGLKVGLLQAANIAGCAAGSLSVGLVLLERLGTAGTLRALVAIGFLFAALGLRLYGARGPFAAAAAALFAALLVLPDQASLWRRLHGVEPEEEALFDEDATGVSGVTSGGGALWNVWVNGKTQSLIPFDGDHTLLGALPALVHEAPVDVAVIGLGSGNTAWAAGCRQETRSITVFELLGGQERLLRRLAPRQGQGQLRRFLEDPRFAFVVADGRNALEHGERLYDFIEADALRPSSAYSGNLYSLEFFERCARRLKPGGLMCTWAPTPRVAATFQQAFPHAVQFRGGAFLVGAREPLRLDLEAWAERARRPEVLEYLGRHAARQVAAALASGAAPPPAPAALGWNRDLAPRDEFRMR